MTDKLINFKGIELDEPETLCQCLYNLLRFDPDRARMTLLRVENGDIPLSNDEKLNELYIEDFSNLGKLFFPLKLFFNKIILVPSLLVLPVETLSSMISLLIKPKVLLQIKNELDQKTGNVSIDLEYWSIPGNVFILSGDDIVY